MSGWVQNLIVALLVIAAAIYATWLLLPSRSRQRVARWLGFKYGSSKQVGGACDRCSLKGDGNDA